jgi:hypothetical protein
MQQSVIASFARVFQYWDEQIFGPTNPLISHRCMREQGLGE